MNDFPGATWKLGILDALSLVTVTKAISIAEKQTEHTNNERNNKG